MIDPSQLDARDAALQKLLLESNLIKDQSELNKMFANEHAKDMIYDYVQKAWLRISSLNDYREKSSKVYNFKAI